MTFKHPYEYPENFLYVFHKMWAWFNVRLPRVYWKVIRLGYEEIKGLSRQGAHDTKIHLMCSHCIPAKHVTIQQYWSTALKEDSWRKK